MDPVSRILPNGRLPLALCSVCKHEDHSTVCTCHPVELLARRDITVAEAYLMIGVQPPDDPEVGFELPLGARRQRPLVRCVNAARRLRYRRAHGRPCKHSRVTHWLATRSGEQVRWCTACGYAEYR